jgi:hypothetical protein
LYGLTEVEKNAADYRELNSLLCLNLAGLFTIQSQCQDPTCEAIKESAEFGIAFKRGVFDRTLQEMEKRR